MGVAVGAPPEDGTYVATPVSVVGDGVSPPVEGAVMYKQQYQYIVCGSVSIKYISNYLNIHLFVNH